MTTRIQKLIAIGLLMVIIAFIIYNQSNKVTALTYDEFGNRTKEITFDCVQSNFEKSGILEPVSVAYPGNPDQVWTSDQFDIVENNVLMPRRISLYVEHETCLSKIDMVYQPDIQSRVFLNVNYFDHIKSEFEQVPLDQIDSYSASFTANGIYFEVQTLSYEEEFVESVVMINRNEEVVNAIQKYIIDNNY